MLSDVARMAIAIRGGFEVRLPDNASCICSANAVPFIWVSDFCCFQTHRRRSAYLNGKEIAAVCTRIMLRAY